MNAARMLLKTIARQGETFSKRSLTDALMMKGMRDAPKWVGVMLQDLIDEGAIYEMSRGVYMVDGTRRVHNPRCRRRMRNDAAMRARFVRQMAAQLIRYVNSKRRLTKDAVFGYTKVMMHKHRPFVDGFGVTAKEIVKTATTM